MARKRTTRGRFQKTSKGQEIPIPKRGDFFDNLKKAIMPEKSGDRRRPKQK